MLEVLARIRHRRTRRQLSPYLDGMLSKQESSRLEEHLAQCQACREELADLRATIEALAELPLAEAPRSFALTAVPQRIEALRPAARRAEFGLGLATALAAFILAVVAAGDLLGVPGGGEEEAPAAMRMESEAAPTETGALQGVTAATPQPGAEQSAAEDKALAEAPTAPPAAPGVEEVTPVRPPATGPGPSPEASVPGIAEPATPAATGTPAAAPAPAGTATPPFAFAPAGTPAPAETPSPEVASPAAAPGTPVATATPPPAGAQIAPAAPGERLTSEAEEGASAEAQPEAPAAEEGGPSRETVVHWLEIGLATGMALLFVSWVLARRRARA
jgi:hypothetical protein